jgi:ligand-binding sensor domain-containing protein
MTPRTEAGVVDYRTGQIAYTREPGIDLAGVSGGQNPIFFMSVVEDQRGNLWMATYGDGVWRYDGKAVTRCAVRDGDKDITIVSIYKDNQGGLWLGTHEAGPYRFNDKTFEKFKP